MTKPSCFKKAFSTESKFCMEVCKHAAECGGVLLDERKKVNAEYQKGVLSIGELAKERFAILKDEIAERRKTTLV